MLFKSFRWMLDPESPLYIQPRLDPSYLRWLAGFLLSARQGEVRARRGGARRALPRERRPLGGVRPDVDRSLSASSVTGCWRSTRTPSSIEKRARRDRPRRPRRASAPSAGAPTKSANASRPSSGRRSAATSSRTTRIASRTARARAGRRGGAGRRHVRRGRGRVRRLTRRHRAAPDCRRRAATIAAERVVLAAGRLVGAAREACSSCACRSSAPRATRCCCRAPRRTRRGRST